MEADLKPSDSPNASDGEDAPDPMGTETPLSTAKENRNRRWPKDELDFAKGLILKHQHNGSFPPKIQEGATDLYSWEDLLDELNEYNKGRTQVLAKGKKIDRTKRTIDSVRKLLKRWWDALQKESQGKQKEPQGKTSPSIPMPDFGVLQKSDGDLRYDGYRECIENRFYPQGSPTSYKNQVKRYKLVPDPDGEGQLLTTVRATPNLIITDPYRQHQLAWDLHQENHLPLASMKLEMAKKYRWFTVIDTMATIIDACPKCNPSDPRTRPILNETFDDLVNTRYNRPPDAYEVFGTAEGSNAKIFNQLLADMSITTRVEPSKRDAFSPPKLLALLPPPSQGLFGIFLRHLENNVPIGWILFIADSTRKLPCAEGITNLVPVPNRKAFTYPGCTEATKDEMMAVCNQLVPLCERIPSFEHLSASQSWTLYVHAARAAASRPGLIQLPEPFLRNVSRPTVRFQTGPFNPFKSTDREVLQFGKGNILEVPLTEFGGRDAPKADAVFGTQAPATWLTKKECGFSVEDQKKTVDAANWVLSLTYLQHMQPDVAAIYISVLLDTVGVRRENLKGDFGYGPEGARLITVTDQNSHFSIKVSDAVLAHMSKGDLMKVKVPKDFTALRRVVEAIYTSWFQHANLPRAWLAGCVRADFEYSFGEEHGSWLEDNCNCQSTQRTANLHQCDDCGAWTRCADLVLSDDQSVCTTCKATADSRPNTLRRPKVLRSVRLRYNFAALLADEESNGPPRNESKDEHEARFARRDQDYREFAARSLITSSSFFDAYASTTRKMENIGPERLHSFAATVDAVQPVVVVDGKVAIYHVSNMLLTTNYLNRLKWMYDARLIGLVIKLCRTSSLEERGRLCQRIDHLYLARLQLPYRREERLSLDPQSGLIPTYHDQMRTGMANSQACKASGAKIWRYLHGKGSRSSKTKPCGKQPAFHNQQIVERIIAEIEATGFRFPRVDNVPYLYNPDSAPKFGDGMSLHVCMPAIWR